MKNAYIFYHQVCKDLFLKGNTVTIYFILSYHLRPKRQLFGCCGEVSNRWACTWIEGWTDSSTGSIKIRH